MHAGCSHIRMYVLCMPTAHTTTVFGTPCSFPLTHSATARRCCTTSWTAESRCHPCAPGIPEHVPMPSTARSAAKSVLVWRHPCTHLAAGSRASRWSCTQANHQLDGALEFLSALGSEPLDAAAFEEASGVGIEVSRYWVLQALERCFSIRSDWPRVGRSQPCWTGYQAVSFPLHR
jgi:Glutaminyl-tRNA synthetase, non-specific RNA binding region part 1